MPRVFGNIHQSLLPARCETLHLADRADFCVGYINLRGRKHIAQYTEQWTGSGPVLALRSPTSEALLP